MEMGESATVAAVKDDPNVYLKAKILEVSFNDVYDACRSQAVITAPHWPAANDGYMQSKKAAVYQIKKDKTHTATVKLSVDSKGITSKGKLIGKLGKLLFEGDAPVSPGTHEVTVTLKETPPALHRAKGKMIWELHADPHAALAGNTQVELFFVFDDPTKPKFFSEDGVWIEALRFIFKEAKLEGTTDIKEGLAKVTKACFKLKANRYEIEKGKANFGGATTIFRLADYMKRAPRKAAGQIESGVGDFVNCYDQAYAVMVFNGALGVGVDALFLQPFGFLKQTQLVGRGTCNNPFPRTKFKAERTKYLEQKLIMGILNKPYNVKEPQLEDYLVVDPKDPDRNGFGNHMFCECRMNGGGIYDACAGPALGTSGREGYMVNSIDTNIPENVRGVPKTEADIKSNAANKSMLLESVIVRGFDITKILEVE